MCPACLTTLALIAASATSTGGLAALVAKGLHAPKGRKDNFHNPDQMTLEGRREER
jgi:hypothetical protein